mgnify:CR=1 FL=1|tara:strand:+ start:5210 stop:6085 length:876 start_codon:yes stop_codon:yes gene_type:complete
MLTFARLGYYGRLGNQMFQYAALVGAAKKLGVGYSLPLENLTRTENHGPMLEDQRFQLLDGFSLDVETLNKYNSELENVSTQWREPDKMGCSFVPEFFNEVQDNSDIAGYFQSEKYFEHCTDDIRKQYRFKPEVVSDLLNWRTSVEEKNENPFVSVHVRRGDYLIKQDYHKPLPVEYYKEAIDYFNPDEYNYIFISDDPHWCKETFEKDIKHAFFTDGNSQFHDMCAMTVCENNIIANSSFSWWGSWLNAYEDKQIIAPPKDIWFGPKNESGVDGLYCDNWTILECVGETK